jgi:endo-1,4-beta-xylanase
MKKTAIIIGSIAALLTGPTPAQDTLKDAFKGDFLIGAALDGSWLNDTCPIHPGLVRNQFNSISPGNVLKWDATEPREGQFNFTAADRYVDFGERNGMFIIGHNLVWHSQTPSWVFSKSQRGPLDRDTMLARMHNHIQAVVGRYKGRIKGWDVVNEGLAEDGTLRDSVWHKIIGDDYIAKAFEFAHEADPDAELYYNDYNIEIGAKHIGALALLKKLLASGTPITGVGIQEHVRLGWPSAQAIDSAISDFQKLGLKVEITELDVDVLPASHDNTADISRNEAPAAALNPYASGLPENIQQALTKRYVDLFAIYLKHRETIGRVTFWGVTDSDSWLNNWPVKGRTSYPLLFDRDGKPKPVYYQLIGLAKSFSLSNNPHPSTENANP